eukprot:350156-Chlamydomonas_euryale.AAC.2
MGRVRAQQRVFLERWAGAEGGAKGAQRTAHGCTSSGRRLLLGLLPLTPVHRFSMAVHARCRKHFPYN